MKEQQVHQKPSVCACVYVHVCVRVCVCACMGEETGGQYVGTGGLYRVHNETPSIIRE